MPGKVVVLGVFNADTTYRTPRLPRLGETVTGTGFHLGPGGKGSNQAVAAARAGAEVHILTKLGQDAFGDMALSLWRDAGVTPAFTRMAEAQTGAACVLVDEETGDNRIVVVPGAAGTLGPDDIDAQADLFTGAAVFVTQLEQPLAAAQRGLERARAAGAITILNPAPAMALQDSILALCDYVTPNGSEAERLTGIAVTSIESARASARALVDRGAGAAAITMGANGVVTWESEGAAHIPAVAAGTVVDTTGAGDCFTGVFAAGLAEGLAPKAALRLASAAAGLAVTRKGASDAMPHRAEIEEISARS